MDFSDISRYYDQHAVAWAKQYDRKSATMHPPLRPASDAISRLRTIRASEELVLDLCAMTDASRVFDLGAGFASSLMYMANIRPDTIYSGICASDTELEINRGLIREAGRVQSISVFKGDFEDGRNYRVFPAQDIVFSLDSWRHSRQPQQTIALIAGMVRPGGRFLIVDWFRVSDGDNLRPNAFSCLDQWRLHAGLSSIPDLKTFLADAESAGFSVNANQSFGNAVSLSRMTRIILSLKCLLLGSFNAPLRTIWRARMAAEKARKKGLLDYRALELVRN